MGSKKLTEEDKENLIIDYDNGINRISLAQKYNLSNAGLYKNIRKLNEQKLTNEQKIKLLERYEYGESISILSKEYNVNYQFIHYLASKNNIINGKTKYKYEINDNFFCNIETEEQIMVLAKHLYEQGGEDGDQLKGKFKLSRSQPAIMKAVITAHRIFLFFICNPP